MTLSTNAPTRSAASAADPQDWDTCVESWIATLAPLTALNYRCDVRQFSAWAGVPLSEVNATHAREWSSTLRNTLSPATLNRRMAALASLFRFAQQQGLCRDNPFDAPGLRCRVSRFGRNVFPNEADVRSLLSRIPVDSERGLRDLALFFGLIATTRRISEWLHIKWSDISEDSSGGHYFLYIAKGNHERRQHLPDIVWLALNRYLERAGRVPAADDYVFCPLGGDGSAGLSTQHAGRLLREYGELAGIDVHKLHLHGLRHFAARWRKQHGATVFELQDTLAHSLLSTTQIYTDAVLSEPADRLAGAVGELLPAPARRALYNVKIMPPASAAFQQPSTAAAPLQQRGRNGHGTGNVRTD